MELEERIKAIYNDCWANYKQYLADHNMDAYNKRSGELAKKYEYQSDIANLLQWFSPKVNMLHQEYMEVRSHVNHS